MLDLTHEYGLLGLAAGVLEDAERNRIANENRLRELTRDDIDPDGVRRGFGLSRDHSDVKKLTEIIAHLAEVEHEAVLNLQGIMRRSSLGPWVKSQKGIGDKQAARLLAEIGDPYWNVLHERPRTVSELWAYCGLHTVPPNGDHDSNGAPVWHVAARRARGVKSNWNNNAKQRVWLIATSMLKAGNRDPYDWRKMGTDGRLHTSPCVRCGPSGKPAQPGSPWSDGHRHADALRYLGKHMLKEMWREASRIHKSEAEAA